MKDSTTRFIDPDHINTDAKKVLTRASLYKQELNRTDKFMKSELHNMFEDENVIRRPRRNGEDGRRYSRGKTEAVVAPEIRM